MGMRQVTPDEVQARAVRSLGLDPEACDLMLVEAVSASLRRAASILCPCTPRTLTDAVIGSFRGLLADTADIREQIEGVLNSLISYGDLREAEDDIAGGEFQKSARLLYAVPPRFVWRESGEALLLGVVPDHRSPLPLEFENRIDYANHVRRLRQIEGEDLRAELRSLGVNEIRVETWLRSPSLEACGDHVAYMDSRLERMNGAIQDLTVVDPDAPVRYWPGRWVPPKVRSGRFVGRRPQLYGSPIWCYVELERGIPRRIIDFPLVGSRYRGCDEAWRLQAAIDAIRGHPQNFRVAESAKRQRVMIEFFSPVPMWAQRRWDALAEPVAGGRGRLFAYEFQSADVTEEVDFMERHLWLASL
jgi:hypothetical protein